MLRVVFFIEHQRLKVRLAGAEERFSKSYFWDNKIEFTLASSGDYMMLWTSLLPDLSSQDAWALVELVGARYPVSDHFQKLKQKCPEIIFTNPTHQWIFYGGTFHPWHQGHQSCLDLVPEDNVCLVLPDRNPQKELRPLDPVFTILKIGQEARFKKNQFLVPTFLLKEKKNPTVGWISKMKEAYPQDEFFLLMGFDSLRNLATWFKVGELLKMIKGIYVVSRLEDEKMRQMTLSQIHQIHPLTEIIFLGGHEFEHISSSEIKKREDKSSL